MSFGGPQIYCPKCQSFNQCKAVPPSSIGESSQRRFYYSDHDDVAWFRRARHCSNCQETFLSAEIDEALLEELIELRKKLVSKRKIVIDKIRSKAPWINREETIPRHLAESFIRRTAWWHTHSSGKPVRAPKHAERIESSCHGWQVTFGGNSFLVGKAIERCRNEINNFMEASLITNGSDIEELKNKLVLHIRGAVANNDGYEYEGYYPIQQNDMMFGAQSIDIKDAVNFIIEQSGIRSLFK